VPAALKAFLLSRGVFDDLGAVMVIALFYTAELSGLALGLAALLLGACGPAARACV
jgi:NhaA family Na+:H+ antiporter